MVQMEHMKNPVQEGMGHARGTVRTPFGFEEATLAFFQVYI